jgi:hypothetical protein
MFAVSRGFVVDKCGHGDKCMMWLRIKIDDIQQTSIRIPASGKVKRHSYNSVNERSIATIAEHMCERLQQSLQAIIHPAALIRYL